MKKNSKREICSLPGGGGTDAYDDYEYVSVYAGFMFDKTGYETYVESSAAVLERIAELFDSFLDDFDAFMDELLQEYK